MGGADAQIVALIEAKNQMSGELATLRRDLGKFADAGEKSSGRFGRAMRTAGKWAAVGIAAASAAAAAAGFAMLKLGSDAEEARNVTGLAFSTMGDKVRKWAEDYALATGSSSYSSIEAASDMGLLFKGMRLSEDASFDLSTKMVKLAGDMASAKNVPLDIALEKIRAGLVGEAEPLRTMGVLLSAARVKEEAYASGIAQTGVELTETQKVMARANIIMNDSIAMHDDLENTQASAANQVRRFWNEIKDGATIVGEALQPALEAVLAEVTGLTGELKDGGAEVAAYVRKWLSDGGLADIKKAVADVREGLEKVVGAIIAIGPYLPGIAKGIGVVLTGVIAWKVGMIAVAVATTTATAGLNLVIPALVAGGAALAAWADYGRDSVDSADALDRKIDVLNTRLEHAYSRWDLTNDQVRANVEAMRGARDAAVLERDALDSLNRVIEIATGEVEGLNTGLDWTPPKARKVEEAVDDTTEAIVEMVTIMRTSAKVADETFTMMADGAVEMSATIQRTGVKVSDDTFSMMSETGDRAAGGFTTAFERFGGWKGMMSGASAAVGAFATGGWKSGVMSMAQTAMNFLPPGVAQAAQAALAAVSAIWSKFKRPSEAELAARKMVDDYEKTAIAGLSESQIAEAMSAGWASWEDAGFLIKIRDQYAEVGKSSADAERDVQAYWDAIARGDAEAIKAQQDAWDELGVSVAELEAAWASVGSSAASAFDKAKAAGINAYDTVYEAAIASGLGQAEAAAKAAAAQVAETAEGAGGGRARSTHGSPRSMRRWRWG